MDPNTLSPWQQKMVNPSTQPANPPSDTSNNELAADVIRKKIEALYANEPDAQQEIQEAETAKHRSKHQEYMHQLTQSGRTPAEIQAAWHQYYTSLPDAEKHHVWQEFYSSQGQARSPVQHTTAINPNQALALPQAQTVPTGMPPQLHPQATPATPQYLSANTRHLRKRKPTDKRSVADIKQQLLGTISSRSKLQAKHQIQSVFFGFGMGGIVLVIFLFGFFNERIIAPFVTPSKTVSNTPIIVDANSTVADATPKVIIPKINVEIPVVYGQTSIAEKDIQRSLEDGVVHYPTTASPGELGNTVIFGHSSNNILNKGKYKFAFVLLNRLQEGDTFMLTKDKKQYVYRVYQRKIVKPTEVSVLENTDRPATASLITCDPPGTSINRLVIIGEQITPDPAANVASTATSTAQRPAVVPSDAPSLWQRITGIF